MILRRPCRVDRGDERGRDGDASCEIWSDDFAVLDNWIDDDRGFVLRDDAPECSVAVEEEEEEEERALENKRRVDYSSSRAK